jgi:hypothetical protein
VELYLHSPKTHSQRGAQLKHRDNFNLHVIKFTSAANIGVNEICKIAKSAYDNVEVLKTGTNISTLAATKIIYI